MPVSVFASRRRALLVAMLALAVVPGFARPSQVGRLKIGIIGTGRIGGALAEHWARAGLGLAR